MKGLLSPHLLILGTVSMQARGRPLLIKTFCSVWYPQLDCPILGPVSSLWLLHVLAIKVWVVLYIAAI